jgi:hypothetical protein
VIPRIEAEVRAAMKSGDARRRDTLRLVLSSLKSAEKDAREDLSEEAALAVLRRERKRRIEAADAYRAGGAEDGEGGRPCRRQGRAGGREGPAHRLTVRRRRPRYPSITWHD